MKTEQKRVSLWDGKVTEVLRGSSSVQVEIENGFYKKDEGYVKKPLTIRLDNPAQAENLEVGTKVAIFQDASGKTNLVREGEWKESEAIMEKNDKNGKEYDQGVAVIMGRCVSARLVQPKPGQDFEPFFTMRVITNDHVCHEINTKNTNSQYGADNIEKLMNNFKNYLENDNHPFIPFTGTFLTSRAYREEEQENGQYKNTVRKYSGAFGMGLLNGRSVISYDFAKAPERTRSQAQQTAQAQQESTSLDTNVELGTDTDGFVNAPDGIDEELPFDID